MSKYDYFISHKPTALGNWVGNSSREYLFKTITQFITPKQISLLEIGPGKGELALKFMEEGCQYTCYDNNSLIIENMKKMGAKAVLSQTPPIPEDSESFDLVVLSHVLEHLPTQDKAFELIQEIARIIKKGGFFLFCSPDVHGWGFDFYEIDYTHAFHITPTRMKHMFEDTGLSIEKMEDRYGNFGAFPGWIIDKSINLLSCGMQIFSPTAYRIVKARLMFHPNLVVVCRKM